MQVHLIHAHPEPHSSAAAMRDTVCAAFAARDDQVSVSDLYAMNFNPVLSRADFGEAMYDHALAYPLRQRRALETGTLSADIVTEVDLILSADLIAFTFPIFWFSTPGILKGWIDRVFLSGCFYGGRRIYGRGGLAGKRSFAAVSLGGRSHMFGPDALHGEFVTGMMRHFFQGTLGYVGLEVYQPFVAHHVPYVDDAARSKMLADLYRSVLELDTRPFLPMPDLFDFDEAFAPKAPQA